MSWSDMAIKTPTKSFTPRVTPKTKWILHHTAGVMNNCLNTFDSRNVSTHFGIGNDLSIRQYVDTDHIAYATGTKIGNENGLNIELSNCGGAPNWPVRDEVIEQAIKLIAYESPKHGIYPLVVGHNLHQHKEFVATYCAGRVGEQLERIAYEANTLIEKGGTSIEKPETVPIGMMSYPLVRRGSRGDYVRIVQRIVAVEADGIFGSITEKAVRVYQSRNGLVVDGIVGPATWKCMIGTSAAMQVTSTTHNLSIGSRGEEVKKVQRIVAVADDGIFGILTSAAVKAYQRRNALVADGIVGVKTRAVMGL